MINSRTEYKARLDAVILYMHEHLAGEIDLAELAKVAGFSPFHFHRLFTSLTGETPQQYLMRMRLEMAANMLVKYFGYSITEIAMQCGFSSPSTFARAFKAHFGVSATAYRAAEEKPVPVGVKPISFSRDDLPALKIETKTVPDWNLAYVSNLNGYDLPLICKAWNQLQRWAVSQGLLKKETRALGISFDDPLITDPKKCRYYACLTIPEGFMPRPPIGFMKLAGSKCLVAHVSCLPHQIQAVYMYLYRDWLVESGFQPDNLPPYEVYLNRPEENPDGRLVMDIYIPIVPL